MGKSKRKRGNPNGPSITPLATSAVSPSKTPLKETVVVSTAAQQSTQKLQKPQQPTAEGKFQSLRQLNATSQAQQSSGNQAGFMKVQYLAKVAEWAAATVPNLGAFFGQRLAAASEALAIPPPISHSQCQRCETVLQVGENCSVRVSRAPKKWRKAKAKCVDGCVKSALVYHCHFCKFGNTMPGTASGHVRTKLSQSAALSQMKKLGSNKATTAIPLIAQQTKGVGTTKIPAATPATALSKNLAKKSIPATAPQVGSLAAISIRTASSPVASSPSNSNVMAETTGSGKKRKRKGWSTLKDIATGQSERATPSRLGFIGALNFDKKG